MIKKYLWTAVFIGLAAYAIFYVFNSLLIILFPYQISYPEGFLLNQALAIAQGRTIYSGIADYPFLVANYPPVYPYLCGLFVKLFGVSFAWGRIISFLSVIACSYLIYLIVNKETGKKRFAALSALLFPASVFIYNFGTQCRVDMLGLLLSLLGTWYALKNIDKKIMYLSILFFVAALFTKQTFAAAPIAFAVYLFIRDRARGFLFIAATLLSYSAVFLILNSFTGGELYRHNVLYNVNPYSFLFTVKMYASLLKTHLILITLAIAYMVFSPVKKHLLSLFPIYFIVAALIAITIGKVGSNVNYFLEFIAAGSIVVGLCASELMENIKTQLILPALLIAQLVLFAHVPFVTGKTPSRNDRETEQRISAIIRAAPGDIISEDAGILVLNDRRVLYQPFEFTQLKYQGLWDQSRYVRDIDIQKFGLLILGSDIQGSYDEERFTPEMAAAMRRGYVLQERIGDWYLYLPIKNNE